MGPRYATIASFIHQGPAMLRIRLGEGVQAHFVVAAVSPPSPTPSDQLFSSFTLAGPYGNSLYLDEDQIAYIQPGGPHDGSYLFIALDNGNTLELSRQPGIALS